MNNKKLFKGALVLFASILMAVSCSNNSTDGGADGNGGNSDTGGSGSDTRTEITDAKLKAALVKGLNASDKSGFIFKNDNKVVLDAAKIDISTSTADTLKIVITDKTVVSSKTAKADTLAYLQLIGAESSKATSTLTKSLAELGITFNGKQVAEVTYTSGSSLSFNTMTASLDTKKYKLGKIGALKDSFDKVEITVVIKDSENWS